mgnify:CR=1 FL=1
MTARLGDFKALTFDCYGTLIDWETGIWDALQPVISANGRFDIQRGGALEVFASLESALEAIGARLAGRPLCPGGPQGERRLLLQPHRTEPPRLEGLLARGARGGRRGTQVSRACRRVSISSVSSANPN